MTAFWGGPIQAVGHVALRVPDLAAVEAYAVDVLGLRIQERSSTGTFLTCDTGHHSVQYIGADTCALDHIGLVAAGEAGFHAVRAALGEEGVRVVDVEEPGSTRAFRFAGPAGHVFEVYLPIDPAYECWYQTQGLKPQRFGHITLTAEDIVPTEEFVQRVLGFRVSDRVIGDFGSWLRCGTEHHSLALMRGDHGIHHYAFDVKHIGEIQRFADLLSASGRRLIFGPGRHGLGANIFTYHFDPAGLIVEVTTDMERIDNALHEPRQWQDEPDMENIWGPLPNDPKFNFISSPAVSLEDSLAGCR